MVALEAAAAKVEARGSPAAAARARGRPRVGAARCRRSLHPCRCSNFERYRRGRSSHTSSWLANRGTTSRRAPRRRSRTTRRAVAGPRSPQQALRARAGAGPAVSTGMAAAARARGSVWRRICRGLARSRTATTAVPSRTARSGRRSPKPRCRGRRSTSRTPRCKGLGPGAATARAAATAQAAATVAAWAWTAAAAAKGRATWPRRCRRPPLGRP